MMETTTTGGPVRDAKLVRGNENGVEPVSYTNLTLPTEGKDEN